MRIFCSITSCSFVGVFATTCCIDEAVFGNYEIHSIIKSLNDIVAFYKTLNIMSIKGYNIQ